MKQFLAIFLFYLGSFLFAQEAIHGFNFLSSSDYLFILSNDKEIIDWNIVDTTAQKLGLKSDGQFYKNGYGLFRFGGCRVGDSEIVLGTEKIHSATTATFRITDFDILQRNINPDMPIYSAGINDRSKNRLYSVLFLSAYLQEKYPTYKENELVFHSIPQKNIKKVERNALLWPSSGYSYLAEGNPIERETLLRKSCGAALMDISCLTLAIVEPTTSGNSQNKIMITGLALSSLVIHRIIARFSLKKRFNNYNTIFESGYRIPNYLP